VLAVGVATDRSEMALVRSSAEGVLDGSWDADGSGLVRTRDGSVATDVVLEPDGRAVAAGHSSEGESHAFMLSPLRRRRRAGSRLSAPRASC
jgi:hypothetical protein